MKLLFANRNYSSWSLRPWLVLKHFDIPFEEELLSFHAPGYKEVFADRSPTGKVPVLIDGDLVIPETVAIIEYVAETHPDKPIWPKDRALRARARAASAEMHGGFTGLRNAAPMNLRASYPGRVAIDDVADDLKRLETLWGELLEVSGGPYLCGTFGAVDAMFAPVATRIRTYALPVSDMAAGYVEAIYALPAFQLWLTEALKEPWIVDRDEIDFIQAARPKAEGKAQ
jgi:glutathione S-transferase